MPLAALKGYWQVTAGVIPGMPQESLTRRWNLTNEHDPSENHFWEDFAAAQGHAMIYALTLQNPQRCNWVTMEWVWL